ncbi:MAG: YbaK/EbsC family protein [Polaromonas sp.]|uniref:YbaK/EbsC family protein n=1 Tax=Polaromonas sp. TaxID=1869339 RepID=UPI0027359065|nr:YbaK/EbsC family protein [Polaromonas sp.]MDP2820263.1 YbaK/EbsC family protein [Polaromonas sp.]
MGAYNVCRSELKVLPEGVQRVTAMLEKHGHPHSPMMLDDAARTAQQAADALGIMLGQIAKSIIFRRKSDDAAVLVITAGDQRVDERKVEALACPDGKRLGRADAEFVKARTGFSIGGVSPLAHATPLVTLIDQSLFRFEEIWAAAGHPHGVFKLSPQQLVDLTGAPVADVVVDPVQAQVSQQHAIDLVAAHAHQIRAEALNLPSPCISVCRMSARTGWCEGCFRTRDEIAGWSQTSDGGKRAVWNLIEQRIVALQA